MNAESAHEIAKELFALECEQRRLTYFIGLLDKRQADVICYERGIRNRP